MATKKSKKKSIQKNTTRKAYPKSSYSYGKRPLSQWIIIYLVLGIVIYGLIYAFVFNKKGSYQYVSPKPPVQQNNNYSF